MISTDVNFNIKSWNKGAEAIYGWQAEEVIGKPVDGLLINELVSNAMKHAFAPPLYPLQWGG